MVSRMIDLLAAAHGLAPVDAYMLCSVCGDLRVSEPAGERQSPRRPAANFQDARCCTVWWAHR